MPTRIYLDHNATAPLRTAARDAMVRALDVTGNPSSIHADGRATRGIIEEARVKVADLVGAEARHVVFASGGTEAACLALTPHLRASGKPVGRLLVSGGEHPCVLTGHRFPADRVDVIGLTPDGVVDLGALRAALERNTDHPPVLALQAANNETGVLQPVAEAAALMREAGGITICDAVQAAGRIPLNIHELGADALLLSAHKFGGPKGVGALVIDTGRLHIDETLVRGGGQERGLRGGTENVAGIAGFGAAAGEALASLSAEPTRLLGLRDLFENRLRELFGDCVIFGAGVPRLPNTTAFALPGVGAETLLIALDLAGVSASSGSACSSGKVRPSHVLTAMGVDPELAKGVIRISTGWNTTQNDVEGLCGALEKAVSNIRKRRDRTAA